MHPNHAAGLMGLSVNSRNRFLGSKVLFEDQPARDFPSPIAEAFNSLAFDAL
jgi:hypothetical protein